MTFGFGQYQGLEFGGKALGIYLSLQRQDEPKRFGNDIADRINQAAKTASEKALANVAGITKRAKEIDKFAGSVPSKAQTRDLKRAVKQLGNLDKIFEDAFRAELSMPELAKLFRSYGRSARPVIGDDLSHWQKLRIPYRFPHTGNSALDFSAPLIDGKYYRGVWYDLGGWKFGSEMTQAETFAYLYYVLDYFLTDMLRWQRQYEGTPGMSDMARELEPVRLFLEGFFYDVLQDPDFTRWKVTAVESHTNLSEAYFSGGYADLAPVAVRVDKPYVFLLRKMMKMGPLTDTRFTEPLSERSFGSLPDLRYEGRAKARAEKVSVIARAHAGFEFVLGGQANGVAWKTRKLSDAGLGTILWIQIRSADDLLGDVRFNIDAQGFVREIFPLFRLDWPVAELYELLFKTLALRELKVRVPTDRPVAILAHESSLLGVLADAIKPHLTGLARSDYEENRLKQVLQIIPDFIQMESVLAKMAGVPAPANQAVSPTRPICLKMASLISRRLKNALRAARCLLPNSWEICRQKWPASLKRYGPRAAWISSMKCRTARALPLNLHSINFWRNFGSARGHSIKTLIYPTPVLLNLARR